MEASEATAIGRASRPIAGVNDMKVSGSLLLASLLLALWGPVGSVQAAPFYGLVPGKGFEQVPIVSMQGRKYQNLIRQHTDFSCGAAALATILKYAYRLDVDENKVLQGLFAVSDAELVQRQGFSLLDIKNYVEGVGYRGRGYRVEANTLENIRIPTIVLLDLKGYKHFVVLKKVDGADVYLADPALGNKVISMETFESQWNGVVFAVIGNRFDRDSVLVNPPPPLTARGLHNIRAPLTNSELLDYGFRHTELF
ncbi:C39 family peptidase [Marinobacterium rhizophilum]|nr:C39 family peptidase [Marinobacterium rhizophilum]